MKKLPSQFFHIFFLKIHFQYLKIKSKHINKAIKHLLHTNNLPKMQRNLSMVANGTQMSSLVPLVSSAIQFSLDHVAWITLNLLKLIMNNGCSCGWTQESI